MKIFLFCIIVEDDCLMRASPVGEEVQNHKQPKNCSIHCPSFLGRINSKYTFFGNDYQPSDRSDDHHLFHRVLWAIVFVRLILVILKRGGAAM